MDFLNSSARALHSPIRRTRRARPGPAARLGTAARALATWGGRAVLPPAGRSREARRPGGPRRTWPPAAALGMRPLGGGAGPRSRAQEGAVREPPGWAERRPFLRAGAERCCTPTAAPPRTRPPFSVFLLPRTAGAAQSRELRWGPCIVQIRGWGPGGAKTKDRPQGAAERRRAPPRRAAV